VVAPAGVGHRRPGCSRQGGRGLLKSAGQGLVKVRWVAYPGWRRGPFHRDGLPELIDARDWSSLALAPLALLPLYRATLNELRLAGPRGVAVGHWLLPGGLIAQMAAAEANGTSATTICHSGALRMVARAPAPIARTIIRRSVGKGMCVATCEELAELLHEIGGVSRSRIVVEPMPVPLAHRVGLPDPLPPFRVLAMGRLVAIKGLDRILESLAGVSDIVLDVAGDGPLGSELEAHAARLGVAATFHGVVVGSAKERLLSSCHGFVLGSRRLAGGRSEGFPVSVLEALEYGVPVLATPVGGLRDLTDVHAGLTVLGPDEDMAAAWPAFKRVMRARWGRGGER